MYIYMVSLCSKSSQKEEGYIFEKFYFWCFVQENMHFTRMEWN